MAVDIVIVTWNALPALRRCLASIRQHTPAGSYTLTVVDNGSTDGTARWMKGRSRSFPLRYLRNASNQGVSKAANLGIRQGTSPWVVRIDDDARVTAGWLDPMLREIQSRPRVGAAGCKVLYADGRIYSAEHRLPDLSNGVFEKDAGQRNYIRTVESVSGTCFFLRRSMLQQLRGFDPSLFNEMDDVDLCLRARIRGWQVLYVGAVSVRHLNLRRRQKARWLQTQSAFSKRWKNFSEFPLPDSHPVDRLYLACVRTMRRAAPVQAVRKFKQLRRLEPSGQHFDLAEGFFYLERGLLKQALGLFGSEARRTDDPAAWTGLAQTELIAGRRRDAERHFRRALKIAPHVRFRVLQAWAQGLLIRGDGRGALRLLREVLKQYPETPAIALMLSRAYSMEKNFSRARYHAQRFLKFT